jgi:hypothetical protein
LPVEASIETKSVMAKKVRTPKKTVSETDQYISDNAQLVSSAAEENRTLHVSQSFSGTRNTSGVVVCFVTCSDEIVMEMQQAIDAAVLKLFEEHGCNAVTIQ